MGRDSLRVEPKEVKMLRETETEKHILGEFRGRDRETIRRDPAREEMADVAQQDTVTVMEGAVD